MSTALPFALEGHRWLPNGQSAFTGLALRLYERLDALFVSWADEVEAERGLYPTFLPAQALQRIDYFRSFPQLATFPCALHPSKENLDAFAKGPGLTESGALAPAEMAPVQDVLTPAACYHIYLELEGRKLERPHHATLRCTCFRREAYYAPLRRQWGFGMREIVCVGSADEVKDFLARYREKVATFMTASGLPIEWLAATDPFFNAAANPKFLAQKIDPVKTEMVFEGEVAIGSVNFHKNFFGEAFAIQRAGEPAFSGCVAFGLERWVYAIARTFGTDPAKWPAWAKP
jgi:seryl-tRNA synthetase